MKFNILDENNKFKLGTVITVFNLPNVEKDLVLFSVEDYDAKDFANLEVAYLSKDSNGFDYIEEINDEKVLKSAMKAVKKIIEIVN